jgi:flagella basal body P-ring formation protein FlgA
MRQILDRATFAALALLTCAAPASAQIAAGFVDPAEIDRAVERFTGAPIGVAGGAALPVDRRLRLAQCRAPLTLGWHGTRQNTVKVECPDQGSWRIFVALSNAGSAAPAQRAERLVARGDAVSIIVRGPGFSVTQTGEAMEAGGQGEWIRVKPPGSAEPLRARIERPGLVTIPL